MPIKSHPKPVDIARQVLTKPVIFSPLLFCLILGTYVLVPTGHPWRWAIYTTPFLVLLESALLGRVVLSKRWLQLLAAYIIYSAVISFHAADITFALKDMIFISLSIFLYSIRFLVHRWFPYFFILAALFSAVVLALQTDAALFALSFTGTRSAAETSVGLAIPLVAFLLLSRRKRVGTALSILAMVLMNKRIALGGFLFLSVIQQMVSVLNTSRIMKISGVLAITVLFAAGLNMSWLFAFVSELARANGMYISPNQLSVGRYAIELTFRSEVLDHYNALQILFGAGPGSSTQFLDAYSQYITSNFPLLHNDWLRIYSEYGIFGLCITLYAMYKSVLKGGFAWVAAIYIGICFLTDNTLTYSFYWFVLIFCLRLQTISPKVLKTA